VSLLARQFALAWYWSVTIDRAFFVVSAARRELPRLSAVLIVLPCHKVILYAIVFACLFWALFF